MRTSLQVHWRIQQVTSIDSRTTQEESVNETDIAPIVAAVLGFPVGLLERENDCLRYRAVGGGSAGPIPLAGYVGAGGGRDLFDAGTPRW